MAAEGAPRTAVTALGSRFRPPPLAGAAATPYAGSGKGHRR
ncbi:hypothetical protein ACWEQ1_10570 [Streptomyces nodosus]